MYSYYKARTVLYNDSIYLKNSPKISHAHTLLSGQRGAIASIQVLVHSSVLQLSLSYGVHTASFIILVAQRPFVDRLS